MAALLEAARHRVAPCRRYAHDCAAPCRAGCLVPPCRGDAGDGQHGEALRAQLVAAGGGEVGADALAAAHARCTRVHRLLQALLPGLLDMCVVRAQHNRLVRPLDAQLYGGMLGVLAAQGGPVLHRREHAQRDLELVVAEAVLARAREEVQLVLSEHHVVQLPQVSAGEAVEEAGLEDLELVHRGGVHLLTVRAREREARVAGGHLHGVVQQARLAEVEPLDLALRWRRRRRRGLGQPQVRAAGGRHVGAGAPGFGVHPAPS
mmetsp:Transcript_36411/g.91994  ORF Transcript_36411/g.91994 Transcript_36411/m.91994 type:complete len:262 (-) Transcript_36411:73-858(-)